MRTNLWRREQRQPVGIHDAAEATNEGGRLLAYLRVHPKVGTVVDVVDPGGAKENVVTNQINNSNNIILLVIVGDWSRAATRMQFVRDNLAHLIFVDRKSEIQVGHFALFGNTSRLLFSIQVQSFATHLIVFDKRQTAIQLRVQRRQLVHTAVQRLVRLAQQLRQKERRKRHINHDALVHCFAQHPADKLKQLQMVLLHVAGGRRIQPLFGRRLEQIQRRIEHALDGLLQELLEHAVLVDARLVQTLLVDEAHTDYPLERVRRQQRQLPVSILDDAIAMHRDQRGTGRRARRLREAEHRFFVLHVLAEQFDAVVVRYDVRHLVQQHLCVLFAFVEVDEEVGGSQVVDEPVVGRRKGASAIASVQAEE